MRSRRGFTLVEMLVAFALILFIMVILTEAFGSALRAFRDLKAVGDMEEKLRSAATVLRRDLAADHFEGRRRLSDPANGWSPAWPAREGFFRVSRRTGLPPEYDQAEGDDSDQLRSHRTALWGLHFTVKLRGNERDEFFLAQVNPAHPVLFNQQTTFFNLPADARHQEPGNTYQSQWAEVAYFVEPNGTAVDGVPLFTLYRTQYVVVADNHDLNRNNIAPDPQFNEMSCQRDAVRGYLHFNTPTDLARPRYQYPRWSDPNQRSVERRRFNPDAPRPEGATPLLSDVVTFDVQALVESAPELVRFPFDTGGPSIDNVVLRTVRSLHITLRVRDPKTQQTRQMTIIQEM